MQMPVCTGEKNLNSLRLAGMSGQHTRAGVPDIVGAVAGLGSFPAKICASARCTTTTTAAKHSRGGMALACKQTP